MFKRRYRLLSHKQIQRLFKDGQTFIGKILLIKYKPQRREKRFAISVSRKHFPKAVIRNRLKRQLREAIRYYQDDFADGHYLFIILKKDKTVYSVNNFQKDLRNIFRLK